MEKAGYEVEQVEDLEKEQKRVFCKAKKEAFELNGLSSEEKRKRGISNNQVCIMTCVDKYGNTFFEPTCVGRLTPKYVKQLLSGKLGEDSIMITDSHVAYRKFAKEEHIPLRQIPSGKHSIGTDNLSYVNSFHSRFADNEQRWSQVNSKYLDHYTALFRWLDKHRAESTQSKVATILQLMTSEFEPLHSRTLKYKPHPFDTKRVIPA